MKAAELRATFFPGDGKKVELGPISVSQFETPEEAVAAYPRHFKTTGDVAALAWRGFVIAAQATMRRAAAEGEDPRQALDAWLKNGPRRGVAGAAKGISTEEMLEAVAKAAATRPDVAAELREIAKHFAAIPGTDIKVLSSEGRVLLRAAYAKVK